MTRAGNIVVVQPKSLNRVRQISNGLPELQITPYYFPLSQCRFCQTENNKNSVQKHSRFNIPLPSLSFLNHGAITVTGKRNAGNEVAPQSGSSSRRWRRFRRQLEQLLLSSAICNGEDLGPFVRKVFASGRPETLLHHLRHSLVLRNRKSKKFVNLTTKISSWPSMIYDLFCPTLILSNPPSPTPTQGSNQSALMELCSRANLHLSNGSFYMAYKCLDLIENEFQDKTLSSTLKRMLESKIPEIRSHMERKISKEFDDWLVDIRVLWAYGYPVDTLLNVLSKHRDKYHELLLSDCRKQIAEALADDKFEQILMKKEYEYSMNVLSFQLQTSDIVPAFPYVAPFSSTVPDCCRIVRFFIADSVSFMSYGWQLDFYDVVKKYLDRLLGEVLDEALLKLISSSVRGVSQAMQVAANMAVLERACDFFFRHAAQLSGIPLRMAERGRKQFPLNNARDAAEETLSGMLKRKVDGFMTLIENVNWTTDEASQGEKIVGALLGDSVKRFNANAKMGIDVDIRLLESFADNLSPALSEGDANQLKSALAESRKLINLLLSNQPENFLNPVIRDRSYNALDYRKVVTISEKLRDSSDRLFGTLGAGVPGRIQKRNLWMHC
ncbi:Exocyst complex component SEC15B [Hibiscus syriacus]|uniref:Exocyst complex component SEC15B n=1 Tax=Hibiscus syriacus TaxID=106335 RepID=A0A6A3AIH3_HIBSY|nr:Exocyst complex component SEC15B [Hibiscus syriacus]